VPLCIHRSYGQVCQCSVAATFVTGDPKTHTVLKAHFGKKLRPEIKVCVRACVCVCVCARARVCV
jgi:hypothetical protein